MIRTFQILLFVAGVLSINTAFGQCKNFVKNNCREAMGEYTPDESFNSAKLLAGDEAAVSMTFYSDVEYRLLICNHPVLGQAEFQVMDADSTILFDNTASENTDHFDFSVEGTRELQVHLKVPESKTSVRPQGCVAIMVGRKISE